MINILLVKSHWELLKRGEERGQDPATCTLTQEELNCVTGVSLLLMVALRVKNKDCDYEMNMELSNFVMIGSIVLK